jgi:hypothetical protein
MGPEALGCIPHIHNAGCGVRGLAGAGPRLLRLCLLRLLLLLLLRLQLLLLLLVAGMVRREGRLQRLRGGLRASWRGSSGGGGRLIELHALQGFAGIVVCHLAPDCTDGRALELVLLCVIFGRVFRGAGCSQTTPAVHAAISAATAAFAQPRIWQASNYYFPACDNPLIAGTTRNRGAPVPSCKLRSQALDTSGTRMTSSRLGCTPA